MKRAQIGLEAGSERGFLDAFVQLKKMRMPVAHAEPKNIRPAFAGKCAKTDKRKEERLPRNGAKICSELFLPLGGNIPEKTERKMYLLGREPAHAAQMRIQFPEKLRDRMWQLDANEEPFRAHLRSAGTRRFPDPLRYSAPWRDRRNAGAIAAAKFRRGFPSRTATCRRPDRQVAAGM